MHEPSPVLAQVLRRALHNEALSLARARAADAALEREVAALAVDGSSVDSLVVTGKLYAQKAMYARAIQCWEAALSLDPENPNARAGITRAMSLQAPRESTARLGKAAPFGLVSIFTLAVITLVATGHWPYYGQAVHLPVSAIQQAAESDQLDAATTAAQSDVVPTLLETATADDRYPAAEFSIAAPRAQQSTPSSAASAATHAPASAEPDLPLLDEPRATTAPAVPSQSMATAPGIEANERVREHVVRRGETLAIIALREQGDWRSWEEIYEANHEQLRNPNLIMPGQVLQIPSASGSP